jgi:glycosyltransferase involved in cell wall biosynthesis
MGSGRRAPLNTIAISVGIPAYSRCSELIELLESIYSQTLLPAEITICEDKSPERDEIRAIVESWRSRFETRSCRINYHENDRNLGYDGNLRKLIEVSHSPRVMLMGNDDLLMPGCMETVAAYVSANPHVPMISRSFVLFEQDLGNRLGVSQLSFTDCKFKYEDSSSGMIMRACGFIGGLIVNRDWALALETGAYDGSLYYQVYLGAVAFCQEGIGYISRQVVAARVGNPPMFGSSAAERGVHIPGSYTPKGRAEMWASVLRIARDVGRQFGPDLVDGLKRELEVRQAFHIFEMMAGSDRKSLSELRNEFEKIGLFGHPVPRILYGVNLVLGSNAAVFYRAVRRLREIAGQIRTFIARGVARTSLEML